MSAPFSSSPEPSVPGSRTITGEPCPRHRIASVYPAPTGKRPSTVVVVDVTEDAEVVGDGSAPLRRIVVRPASGRDKKQSDHHK